MCPQQNSHFVAAMEQVLDIYKRPYNKNNPVVCMDESPKQLIMEVRRFIPMKPGQDSGSITYQERKDQLAIYC